MSRACLHRQIHEQRLRFSTQAVGNPGSRKNAPRTLRSERGTPPATPPTRGRGKCRLRGPKPLRFSVRLSADHPTPILMHAGRRPGRKPSLHLSPRVLNHLECDRTTLIRPSGSFSRQREKATEPAFLSSVIRTRALIERSEMSRASRNPALGNHTRTGGSWAPAFAGVTDCGWHCAVCLACCEAAARHLRMRKKESPHPEE